jgi:pimeloyl-ACP methyl ester carboxylesterase
MNTTLDLHISRWGETGERLLLLHGGNTANPDDTWEAQRVFAESYQLLIPHRRGYGLSPLRGPDWTYTDDIADLLPLLGEGAHLVGLSYGGLLALLLTGERPDLVRSLTVIEPPVFLLASDDPEVARLIAGLTPVYAASPSPEVFIRGFVGAMGQQLPATFQLSPQHRKSVEATMREPAPWTIPLPLDELARLNTPKLVVSGDWHPAFIATEDRLAERIAAQRLLIADAGHGAQGSGQPFNDRLRALLQSA